MTIEAMTWVAITPKHVETAVKALRETGRRHKYAAMEIARSYEDDHGVLPCQDHAVMKEIGRLHALEAQCNDACEAILSSSKDVSPTPNN